MGVKVFGDKRRLFCQVWFLFAEYSIQFLKRPCLTGSNCTHIHLLQCYLPYGKYYLARYHHITSMVLFMAQSTADLTLLTRCEVYSADYKYPLKSELRTSFKADNECQGVGLCCLFAT
jgi:hypothetical protein